MYGCAACGYRSAKWAGFCSQCGAGALEEVRTGFRAVPLRTAASPPRRTAGDAEVDRVLGGGLVPGSVVLLGGEPGVGKSTLVMQWASSVGGSALVVSAEESPHQVAMRAERLGVDAGEVLVSGEATVPGIVAEAERLRPRLLVVDSVQTVSVPDAGGIAGGPGQVREAAAQLVAFAKRSDVPVIVIGHVTKDGSIAGPKLLEHMVDVVLYLEGDAERGIRFLRSVKNRFGAVNDVGVFEMTGSGLRAVPDPSGALIADRDPEAPGSVLFPTIDGRRAVLVEVQALAVRTANPQPRRSAKGIGVARLHQVLAVLERHAGIGTGSHDVYLSIMGGMRVTDPAADLPIALAVTSAVTGRALGATAAWGEVGLTGELRSSPRGDARRAEAKRFEMRRILAPNGECRTIGDAVVQSGLRGAGRVELAG